LGVGIPGIRSIVESIHKQKKLGESSITDQKKILDLLMMQDYAEEKLAAVIYAQLYMKDVNVKFQPSMISGWFDKKWIYDWNVCD